ncbi:MAG TPA: AbrB/MazE/SpoVT family DNA-binding domain-containing protein [Thermoanaerobaculia bacterium]|nr:AbrB/MazE/SpoVT family DNA-binding domain-containing protein [Thermoanaerobaculia bacterium]
MRTHIVRIGNSQGVRIPKTLLEQTGLRGAVEISVRNHSLVIEPVRLPRAGWEASFREMARKGDDRLLEGEAQVSNSFDDEEWEWK